MEYLTFRAAFLGLLTRKICYPVAHLDFPLELSQIHGKPWYPVSCTFLSLKTVEFYGKLYGLLPQDFNLGQNYLHVQVWL